jgi:hypothetical protein
MKATVTARIEAGQLRIIVTPTDRLAVAQGERKTVLALGKPHGFESDTMELTIEIEDYDPGTIAKIKQLGE